MIDQNNSSLFGQGIIQKGNAVKVIPASIQTTALSNKTIKNSNTFTSGALSLTNGNSVTVQTILTSTTNQNLKLAAVPYCIVFFQTALTTGNIIGSGITGAGYAVKGPFCMPTFSPNAANLASSTVYGGSTGNNLVFITELYNNTGSTQTIYYIEEVRFIQSGGGAS